MKLFYYLFLLISITSCSHENNVNRDQISPEYPGGDAEMINFIVNNFNYPEYSIENNEQGTIIVQFIISKDGKIKDTKIVQSISKLLDYEALRIINKMPKWKPGEQLGEKVEVRYTLPIYARIN